jgi:DNA-directed RNA polymerase specialized sigma24 family protein
MTEGQVVADVEQVLAVLAPQFAFASFTPDDMRQEGWIFALDLLERGQYDPSRKPLHGYLYRHIRNRFINLKRDRFVRADPPCQQCHDGCPCGADGNECRRYAKWRVHQERRKNLNQSIGDDTTQYRASSQSSVEENAQYNELRQLLEDRLSPGSKKTLDALLRNEELLTRDHMRLRREVRGLLGELESESPLAELYGGLVDGLRLLAG